LAIGNSEQLYVVMPKTSQPNSYQFYKSHTIGYLQQAWATLPRRQPNDGWCFLRPPNDNWYFLAKPMDWLFTLSHVLFVSYMGRKLLQRFLEATSGQSCRLYVLLAFFWRFPDALWFVLMDFGCSFIIFLTTFKSYVSPAHSFSLCVLSYINDCKYNSCRL
jgi:hypothetical protein